MVRKTTGRLEVMQHLIQQGADKDKTTNDGCTPLYIAAHEGRLEVVQYLVQQGADKDKARDNVVTPLLRQTESDIAAMVRRAKVLALLFTEVKLVEGPQATV